MITRSEITERRKLFNRRFQQTRDYSFIVGQFAVHPADDFIGFGHFGFNGG